MTAARSLSPLISPKFLVLVAIAFLVHIVLIFWLSERGAPRSVDRLARPGIMLVTEDPHELLRFADQSLFGLPHVEGFSGDAWLRSAPIQHKAFDWTEPPRWLPVRFQPVRAMLAEVLPAVRRAESPAVERSKPDVPVPGMLNVSFLPERSRLRVLAGPPEFESLQLMELPSWQHSDLLGATTVQVVANEDGKMLSATLIAPGSGNPAADEYALKFAKAATINASITRGELRWATLSFEWHTTPPQAATPESKAQ